MSLITELLARVKNLESNYTAFVREEILSWNGSKAPEDDKVEISEKDHQTFYLRVSDTPDSVFEVSLKLVDTPPKREWKQSN